MAHEIAHVAARRGTRRNHCSLGGFPEHRRRSDWRSRCKYGNVFGKIPYTQYSLHLGSHVGLALGAAFRECTLSQPTT
jgi:hypothetical protein